MIAFWDEMRGGDFINRHLFEGVSIWFTDFVRLFCFIFGLWAIKVIFFRFHKALVSFGGRFENSNPADEKNVQKFKDKQPDCFRDNLLKWKSHGDQTDSDIIWREYCAWSRLRFRITRVLIASALFFMCGSLLFIFLGYPYTPGRTEFSRGVDKLIIILNVGAFIVLVFTVVDISLSCRKFINYLSHCKKYWNLAGCNENASTEKVKIDAKLDLVNVIARHSKQVEQMIYFPCIMLFLMILSRNSIFDKWDWPLSLILIMMVSGAVLVWSMLSLRKTGQKARIRILSKLEESRYNHANNRNLTSFIERAVDRIKAERRGAFSPLREMPLIRFLLVPFAGLGSIPLITYVVEFLDGMPM